MKFTIDELVTDDSFIDYCLKQDSPYKAKWERFMEAHPDHLSLIDEARELILLLHPQLPQSEINVEMHKLYHALEERNESSTAADAGSMSDVFYVNDEGKLRGKKIRRILLAGFATIMIAFLAYSFWPSNNVAAEKLSWIEHKSEANERKRIKLPDGTNVILNSNSILRYTGSFDKKDRTIELVGEAYFEVAKNPKRPFIVRSGEFSTTAIGTAFYVNGRHPSESYKVSLREGQVRLNNSNGSETLLKPGEQANWTSSNKTFYRTAFDTLSIAQWIDNKLSLKKEESKKLFDVLSEWYGIDIEDRRTNRKDAIITGDYSNKPVEDVLKVICFSLSCKYTISANKIVIQ